MPFWRIELASSRKLVTVNTFTHKCYNRIDPALCDKGVEFFEWLRSSEGV